MEDKDIIALYWDRNQQAIVETDIKYGKLCKKISMNILSDVCDCEECVNDTYHKAWNTIPPTRPDSLRAYLGRIVRNISISLYRARHAAKRDCGFNVLLSELEECVESREDVEKQMELRFLTEILNRWLYSLKEEDMALFVRRYWHGDSVETIAGQWNVRANKLSVKLCRLRKELKKYLEKEGIMV